MWLSDHDIQGGKETARFTGLRRYYQSLEARR